MANDCDKQPLCQRPPHAETMKMLSNFSEIAGTIFVKDSDTIDVYGEVIKDLPGAADGHLAISPPELGYRQHKCIMRRKNRTPQKKSAPVMGRASSEQAPLSGIPGAQLHDREWAKLGGYAAALW